MRSRVLWLAVLLSVLIHIGFGLFAYYVEPSKKSERIRVAIKFAEERKEEKKKEAKVEEKKPENPVPKKIEDNSPKPVKKEEERPKALEAKLPTPPVQEPKKVEEKKQAPKQEAKAEPPKTVKPRPPVSGSKFVRKSGKPAASGDSPKTPGIPINTDFTQGGGGTGGGGVEVPVGDGYYGNDGDDGGELVMEGEVTAPNPGTGIEGGTGGDDALPVESAGGKGISVGGSGGGGPGGGEGGGGGAKPVVKPKPKTETVAKVSKPAKVAKQVKVGYPDELRTLEIQGRVKLELVVDETGKVIYVAIKQGLHPKLDELAEKAAWQLEFEPAMKDDVPVKTTIPYTFTFVME